MRQLHTRMTVTLSHRHTCLPFHICKCTHWHSYPNFTHHDKVPRSSGCLEIAAVTWQHGALSHRVHVSGRETVNLSLTSQTDLWICEDQPKCPHNSDIKVKCVHTTIENIETDMRDPLTQWHTPCSVVLTPHCSASPDWPISFCWLQTSEPHTLHNVLNRRRSHEAALLILARLLCCHHDNKRVGGTPQKHPHKHTQADL